MLKVLLLACCFVGESIPVQAKNSEMRMTFHGRLMEPPPCTINNNNRVNVDFGERVGINTVDGVNNRIPLNYQITCKDSGSGWALALSLGGSVAGFDSTALQTDKAGLGIRIYQNDKPFTPNSTLKISLSSLPRLEAVPVRQAGVALTEGAFEAWATLRADYQ